jgi:hypothetical protein
MDTSFRAHSQPMNITNMTGLINQERNGSQKVPQDAFPPADLDLLQSNVREIEPERKTSMPVAVGSLIGTILPMIVMAGMQGKFKDAKGLKKVLAPFMVHYEWKQIYALGASAILGGLAGGIINDKGKDTWAKIKEGNYQFITNIAAPVALCLFFDEQVKKLGEKFPKMTWLTSEKLIHKIPISTLINLLGIVGGVTIGSFISNQLNKRIHKDDIPPRKIHAKDFVIQVDDMAAGFTATKALDSIPYLCHVDKILPLVYLISGMETGNEKGDEKGEPPSKAVT